MEKDNDKIMSGVKKIYYCCNKFIYKKKQEYFYDLCAKIYKFKNDNKFHTNKKKKSFYERLFNDSIKKQEILNNLEKKINKNEEKIYTFSPKINKIKKYKKNKIFEIITNNPRNVFSMKFSNKTFNYNLNEKYKRYLHFNNNFYKTNSTFYQNNTTDEIILPDSFYYKIFQKFQNYELLKNKNFLKFIENDFLLNAMNQKNQMNKKHNKKIDLFDVKYYNGNSYNKENEFVNKNSRNIFGGIQKSRTTRKNNSSLNLKEFNGIFHNYEINEKGNRTYINKIPRIHKKNLNNKKIKQKIIYKYENILNDFIEVETSSLNDLELNKNNLDINRLYRRTIPNNKRKDAYYIFDNNYTKNLDSSRKNCFLNRNEYYEIKKNRNKSLNELNNIEKYESINRKNKRVNSLKKYNLNSLNRITHNSIYSFKNNFRKNIFYDPIKYSNKTIESQSETQNIHKICQSLNSNRVSNEVLPFSLKYITKNTTYEYNDCKPYENNNYLNTNSNESNNSNEINIHINNNKENKTLNVNEYYYTFRKKRIPYNSFNYLTYIKSKNNNISNKNNNNFNNQKLKSLSNDKNKVYYYSVYNAPEIDRSNGICSKNNNNKLFKIKKNNSNLFKTNINSYVNKSNKDYYYNSTNYKGSYYELSNKKDINGQILNTNYNTNNDTKGCTISSYSLYHTKSPKENQSNKNSNRLEDNFSITSSKSKCNSLSKQNTLTIKKIKAKKNLRKYIENMKKIPNNRKKSINFYCNNEEKKNDNEIISEIENKKYKVDSNVVNECYINKRNNMKNIKNMKTFVNSSINGKNERSLTLQSLSDSKMFDLAEHYINKDDDSLDKLDMRLIQFKKNFKNEKTYRDITFG